MSELKIIPLREDEYQTKRNISNTDLTEYEFVLRLFSSFDYNEDALNDAVLKLLVNNIPINRKVLICEYKKANRKYINYGRHFIRPDPEINPLYFDSIADDPFDIDEQSVKETYLNRVENISLANKRLLRSMPCQGKKVIELYLNDYNVNQIHLITGYSAEKIKKIITAFLERLKLKIEDEN